MTDLTKKQANALERMTSGEKIPRKLKKRLQKEIAGWKRPKRPRKISAAMRARRKEKRKAAQEEARILREAKMMERLVKCGWKRSGPNLDVWSIGGWKDGYPDTCYQTLHRAYKIQLKLESEGYQRPLGVDDDLMSEL
tara:strand:+ start:93 stop:506 length:414 start_codon:yes stop_codon:yes gene_type:complete